MPKEIYLVKVGMNMTDGIVEEWCVADGGRVEKGELVYRLETEKVNLDVDAEASGVVKHIVAEGVPMKPGDVVGYIYEAGESVPDILPRAVGPAAVGPAAGPGAPARAPATPAPTGSVGSDGRLLSSPAARRLSRELNVDITALNGSGPGGSSIFGYRARTGVARDPLAQPDAALRALNEEEPAGGPRSEVYCSKVGATRPDAIFILGAHMDGLGFGEAADDDASGTAIVMELARILSASDVETAVSIRFALWNNEETGLNGSRAYVEQRRARQGVEEPPGSGRYPEPRWLGMIQHDMMLFDHGAPGPDGVVSRDQRREADVNIEFQSSSTLAAESRDLAFHFKAANDAYATDYPATVGPHMTNTDSTPFMNDTPSISLRENERGMQIGAGWNPHWHQPTDLYRTYTDDDFRLGLNAAQTTLAAIAKLAGATVTAPR